MKHLKTLIKMALVIALFWFLYKKGLISFEQTKRAILENPGTIAMYVAILVGCSFLGALRWAWLLKPQHIELSPKRILELALIGNFFNIALPGAVSGDVVKAFYIAKEAPGSRSPAFGSILFDRIVGLSALVLVAATAIAVNFGALSHHPLLRAVQSMMIVAAISVAIFYVALFFISDARDPILLCLRWLSAKVHRVGSVLRIYESVRKYQTARIPVLKALLLSLAIHSIVGICCLGFLKALGSYPAEPLLVFIVVPLGLLVTAVPIAPAGVGTGHAAFSYLFPFLGVSCGADLFTLYALTQLFVGAIGGLVYLRFKGSAFASEAPHASGVSKPSH